MTLFVKTLNIDVASRIWDLFILEGEIILFRVSIALMREVENDILRGSFEEIINGIKTVGIKIKDPEKLLRDTMSVEIPEWVIEEVPKIINECIPK